MCWCSCCWEKELWGWGENGVRSKGGCNGVRSAVSEPGRITLSPTLRSMGNKATGSTNAATEVSVRKREGFSDTILCRRQKSSLKTMSPSKQRPNRPVFAQNQAKQNTMVYRAKRTIVPRLQWLQSENKRNTIKNLARKILYAGDFSQALVVISQMTAALFSELSFLFYLYYRFMFLQRAAGHQIEADTLPDNVNHHGGVIGKTFCDISQQQTWKVCLLNTSFTLW